ncbi:MAG: fumarylacetoacetate hydrolase family protein [Gammaproteobacteria bacterium]
MRLATIGGRAHVIDERGGLDIAAASRGRFPASMRALLAEFDAVRDWMRAQAPAPDPQLSMAALDANLALLDAPVSDPTQIFAVGLNYQAHGDEVSMAVPSQPMIFAKFASSLAGAGASVPLPAATVDWEVEMVVVIGRGGRHIPRDEAHRHVAGYCVGQDFSERALQMLNNPPQFGLAKSFEGFSPIGPWITTADEIDSSNLRIACANQWETLQDGNTCQMIFDVASLVSYLSWICELRTGDLIFSGTPSGVGMGRKPPRYIESGWVVESTIEGLGRLRNPMIGTPRSGVQGQ